MIVTRGRIPVQLVIALAIGLILLPALAEAKAGSGASMGSRGTRTFQPNGAQSIERSVTPPPAMPSAPSTLAPTPAPSTPMPPRPGSFQRNPFLGGLLGGLVGAGLGSLLFGGPFFGSGIGGIIGLLLQVGLIVLLARAAFGFFQRRTQMQPRPAAAAGMAPLAGQRLIPANPVEFSLAESDLSTFERMLLEIQAAWTRGDIATLRHLTTPEIASYLEEQLRDNWARGLQNQVDQVRLLKGDVVETWREAGFDFATVSLRWSCSDYMVQAGGQQLVAGDPMVLTQTTEVWTFIRRPQGPWQLSAIQQV